MITMKITRKQLRKMILQEGFLFGEPDLDPSEFSKEDHDFARALRRRAAIDYSRSQIQVDLSKTGVTVSSTSGAFPSVTLKVAGGPEFDIDGKAYIYISGPGGLGGRFRDNAQYANYIVDIAAKKILARLHGQQ